MTTILADINQRCERRQKMRILLFFKIGQQCDSNSSVYKNLFTYTLSLSNQYNNIILFLFPAHKEGCYIKEINDVIPFGAEYTPIGYCMRVECTRTMIYYAT